MDTRQQESWKILLIGDSCEDIYHYGVCNKLSPEAPVPVLKQERTENKLGMSSNVRLNLESFGMSVFHFHNTETIKKHRLIDVKHNQHLLRFDEGEEIAIKPFDVGLLTGIKDEIDAVVISDYDKGFLTDSLLDNLCYIFKDKPIFVDSKKQDLSFLSECIVKINEKEFNQMTKPPKDSELIVTLGEKGAMYNDKLYSVKKTEVFDVCGAGDVFLSALVFGYLNYGTMSQSIKLANACASISVSKLGAYVLKEEDLEKLL